MTQEEIIEMSRQAGFETQLRKGKILGFDRDGDYTEELEAFAALVAAKERERTIAEIIAKNKPEIEKCNAYIKELEDKLRGQA
jgi:predicted membrane GTPase involved in stress response